MSTLPSTSTPLRIAAIATACAALMGLVAAWSESQSAGVRIALLVASAFGLAVAGAVAALRAVARSERDCARLLDKADDARALRDAVMDITPVGFAFYDRDLRYVHVNAALAAMNGLLVEAHLGRHVSEVLPELGTMLGPGFKSEDLPHVFEPFFSKRRGGTGLGLSIVQRILEEHQGRIRLSNHPQGGAEVTILLPALFPAVHTGPTPQSQVS
ncbi:ATP-binding protein [Corallococcus exiguus]|uniref:histidine kinase n=1 Tax=Corallococcus exiguus TaxID=83462 RepID=A0A7X4YJ06_9BACT|nr:ATP-binding protein [Corallococcus exiguus]NBC46165.1 PAS domain-containing protein [Corallococcus exiguus]TNV52710.1 hypothetical protein FH620_37710 [Corallococcus exiguus]